MTANSLTDDQLGDVERALGNHEKLRGSYFWHPYGNAASRRNDEKRYSFGVTVEYKGDIYKYRSNVSVSVKNFYYAGSFHKNGVKGDVRLFKKLLESTTTQEQLDHHNVYHVSGMMERGCQSCAEVLKTAPPAEYFTGGK